MQVCLPEIGGRNIDKQVCFSCIQLTGLYMF